MFWGCITYYGVGTLVAIDGNMNTDKYISVLDDGDLSLDGYGKDIFNRVLKR
jgi:hypothetical protein